MHWVIYIFGGGLALFVGASLLFAAIVPSISGSSRSRLRTLLAVVGMIFLTLSAVPLPLWCYAIIGVLLLTWLATVGGGSHVWRQLHTGVAILALAALVAVVGNELRYQFPQRLNLTSGRRIELFGDSLAAGVSDYTTGNWPELLTEPRGIALINHASPGAKVATALRKAQEAQLADGVVLVEIGGNDLLDGDSVTDFARELDQLLNVVSEPGRQVVMFELPLPPFHQGYGLVQRRLAAKYGVHLIPKRVLMGILTTQGATIDSLHLSPAGHQQLADATWRELESAFEDAS